MTISFTLIDNTFKNINKRKRKTTLSTLSIAACSDFTHTFFETF